ncbi:hypothetical protein CWT12_01535 [Actinomyces sp. 432]|uniref:hypothetical protein n=1 Tax=Actinomyces sp. 432 TaxID=2057798 RepID=UPI001373E9E9|nr:hypothetical protein [Actinomyces sp. 432]QHO90284.1 hypothetical protein CWT12_01535 [Actinomyces sp. 432]
MSCYTLSDEHINVLIDAAIRYSTGGLTVIAGDAVIDVDRSNRDRMGQVLLDTNVDSVNARYNEDDVRIYQYRAPHHFWEPVHVLKAISCYEYNAREAPGWETSVAAAFCRSLRDTVVSYLPGYDEAPWEIDPNTVPTEI